MPHLPAAPPRSGRRWRTCRPPGRRPRTPVLPGLPATAALRACLLGCLSVLHFSPCCCRCAALRALGR
eukprot:5047542-Alexandrium_andersonii.AAC.1